MEEAGYKYLLERLDEDTIAVFFFFLFSIRYVFLVNEPKFFNKRGLVICSNDFLFL